MTIIRDDEKNQIIDLILNDKSMREISNITNILYSTINNYIYRFSWISDLYKQHQFFNKIDKISELINIEGFTYIDRICPNTLLSKLRFRCNKCNNVFYKDIEWCQTINHICPYCYDNINHDFFATWSHDMAYLLGIMLTDGCVTDKNLIYLGMTDIEPVQFFRDNITPDKLIYERKYNDIDGKYKGKRKKEYRFSFVSQQLCDDLSQYGVIPRKTYSLIKIPDCPSGFLPSLLRGMFDGDGNISDKTYGFSFVAKNKLFVEDLYSILLEYQIITCIKEHNNCYYLYGRGGITNTIKFGKLLYSVPGCCIERKRQSFDNIILSDIDMKSSEYLNKRSLHSWKTTRLNYNQVTEHFQKYNFELFEPETYKNSKTKIKIKCNLCNSIRSITLNNFNNILRNKTNICKMCKRKS